MSSEIIARDQDQSELPPLPRSAHLRRSVVGSLAVAGVCVLTLIGFTVAVEGGLVSQADRRVELLVHADVTPHLYGLMTALSFIGSSGSIAVLAFACVVFYLRSGDRWSAAFIAACPTGAGILDTALKDLFQRVRPHLWPHAAIIHSYSFPSGHATIGSAFLAGVAYAAWKLYGRRIGALAASLCALLAAGIGFSRVYLGVHWPSDVLAGFALGLAWVFILVAVLEFLRDPATRPFQKPRKGSQNAARDGRCSKM